MMELLQTLVTIVCSLLNNVIEGTAEVFYEYSEEVTALALLAGICVLVFILVKKVLIPETRKLVSKINTSIANRKQRKLL